ncbi:MAG: helix-turn-helix domain-containing protein [Bacteriovorax sp.]|nr:helix-turn-helix domain-containing protein [Bacteriovorax sp.]
MNKLIKIEELVELLQVKESLIRSLIFRKKIPFIKIGRLIRFDVEEINKWLRKKPIN